MKNFLAVIAGLAFTILIAVGFDFVMHSSGVFSDEVSGMGPLWYPLVLLVTAIPCTWLGGKLANRPHA